jgi:hypothetical protein
MRRIDFGLAVMFFIALPHLAAAAADCQTHALNNAFWIPQDNTLSISLEGEMNPATQGAAQWSLIDMKNGSSVAIPPQQVSYTYNTATIQVKGLIQLNDPYYVAVTGIEFVDCSHPQEKFAPINLQTKRTIVPTFKSTPSTSRDDSDFYFSPTIDGATGAKASYTADAKLQLRKALLAPSFGRNQPYRPAIFFIPGVDLKISSNTKQDGNSVLFRAPLEVVSIVDPDSFPKTASIIPSLISQPAFVAESDKKFHDINAIFSDSEYIVLHTFGNRFQFTPEPMIGFEIGSNLKAQQTGTYPAAILRANFGLHLGMNIFQAKKPKPLFSIESDYIRRLLLHPEPTYATNSKGGYVLVSTGTSPRDYVIAKLSYNLTSYVGLTIAYEYGHLPPIFTKVDDKYTLGITFKGQLQYKPAKSAT